MPTILKCPYMVQITVAIQKRLQWLQCLNLTTIHAVKFFY